MSLYSNRTSSPYVFPVGIDNFHGSASTHPRDYSLAPSQNAELNSANSCCMYNQCISARICCATILSCGLTAFGCTDNQSLTAKCCHIECGPCFMAYTCFACCGIWSTYASFIHNLCGVTATFN